ncbi:uncharacterized protein LOC105195426 isoform X1 [Solenopsis invicta]|uniref:uncharacterized protein LOC105195426 isoform X1 n=1 Tax=Solenopsis invicta TaxID=13686 RepID=UPI000595EA15|nr:uncharacterized protein LOC105195426 isoform X1 [Solenopsis invicta]
MGYPQQDNYSNMICPELVSDYFIPVVKWYQTDIRVVISIQLPDVTDYYLRIERLPDNDCLHFSTETNGKQYYLILHLYGAVAIKRTMHKNVGREIKIYLAKAFKWLSWLRLIKSKEKEHFISYDPEHIQDTTLLNTNGNYDIGRFARYKRENNIINIMPVVPSSDEEESEDEQFIDSIFSYG